MTPSHPDLSNPLPDSYRKVASLFGAATAALGLLGLSGWILGMPLLASIRTYYIPMAPLTAIIFVCLGGLLLVHSMWPSQGPVGILAAVFSALLSAYGLIELVEYLGIPLLSLEEWLFPDPPMMGAIPTGRISPLTSALVLLSGAVVPMLFLRERRGERHKLIGDLAGCLGILVAMAGTVFLLSYMHGTPLLYGTLTIPMAATTALSFLLLGTGQILAVGPYGFPLRFFVGQSARARLLRVFVSTTVGVVVAIDLLHVYAPGIFLRDNAFLSGISTTAIAVITGALIARVAFKVGDDMDRSEEVRKRAAEALRESEERYHELFENANDIIYTHDLAGNFTSINKAAERVTGYTRDEALKMNIDSVLAPEYVDVARQMLSRKVQEGGQTRYELEIVCKDGRRVPVEINTRIIYKGGKAVGVQGIARDITERKRAEEALRESEEKHRGIFDESISAIYIFDGNKSFIDANQAGLDLLGYSREELLHMSIPDVDADPDVVLPAHQQLFSGGRLINYEHKLRRKDGAIITVLNNSSPLMDLHGKAVGMLSTLIDITDRKRFEEEKERLQSQFQQSMKMEAVGRLAGGVAHDFNNLLTAIIGNVSLAFMKLSPSDPVGGLLSEANKAAERAATLTQQLLAFSRKQIIAPKVLDVNALVSGLAPMLSRLIGEQIELETVPGKDLGLVKVDPGQFEQVLVNLAVNARDAMPEGGRLSIGTSNADLDASWCSLHPGSVPGRYVLLSVGDTGHGMSEEVRSRLFEPFFTTKPVGSGTGLGLASVYGVVKQSGGVIEVDSEVGKGSTFRVFLPRVEGELTGQKDDAKAPDLPGGSETVLVVEDDEMVRNLCVRILERLGYRVMQASNGDEAIALAKEHVQRIDLLMTDVVMPGIDGRELANRLTRIHPETRVLFTSGYTDNAIVHYGVLAEGVSFIGKPYSISALAKKVRDVLDKA